MKNATTTPANLPANQNAVKEGLYTRGAYIRPGEEAAYQELASQLLTDLLPEGALETVFAREIINATWRLRRCGDVESSLADQTLVDPMEHEVFDKKQRSIDRARAQAHNIIRRSLAELRKLQTERTTRGELEINHQQSVLIESQKVCKDVHAYDELQEKAAKRARRAQRAEFDRQLRELQVA